MRFLTKRYDYRVEYSKAQARTMLLGDRRVDKVVCKRKKMIIKTVPIKPTDVGFKDMILVPFGTFTIKLTEFSTTLHIDIIYDGKITYAPNPHLNFTGGLCWGNAEEEVEIIRSYKDWFWLAKRCLDLIDDFEDEDWCDLDLVALFIKLQLYYAKAKRLKGRERLSRKLEKKWQEYVENDDELTEYDVREIEEDIRWLHRGDQDEVLN